MVRKNGDILASNQYFFTVEYVFESSGESHSLQNSSEIYRKLYWRYAFDPADSLKSIRNFWDWKFAKNRGVVYVFANTFWLVYRVVTIFYWRKDLGQADLWDTLNILVKSTENFLEAFEKKIQLKKWGTNENQYVVGIFWQNLIFWAEAFFQRSLETFLWILRTCSSYLKGTHP